MAEESSSGKRFKKQYVQMASSDEIIRASDLEDFVCDPEASNIIRIVDETCWRVNDDFFPHGPSIHDFSDMREKCANCSEDGSPASTCLSRFDNQIGCVWFEPTQQMAGKTLKKPAISSILSSSVSVDLYANFWNGQCVTIPPKTFRQIGIGHRMERTATNADDRTCTRSNWIAKIISTPSQDAQGIFHGTGIIDPVQCNPDRKSHEIKVTLFNFSDRPYAIFDHDIVGRLIFMAVHVPDVVEKRPYWGKFRGMFIQICYVFDSFMNVFILFQFINI
jgi:dUTPase